MQEFQLKSYPSKINHNRLAVQRGKILQGYKQVTIQKLVYRLEKLALHHGVRSTFIAISNAISRTKSAHLAGIQSPRTAFIVNKLSKATPGFRRSVTRASTRVGREAKEDKCCTQNRIRLMETRSPATHHYLSQPHPNKHQHVPR